MKIKMVLLSVLATLLVSGAEKNASPEQVSYAPNEVKIVGVLNYGQKSGPVDCSDSPRYRAFVFEGQGDDRVEVTITGAGEGAFIAVADPSLHVIATGTGHLFVSLPDHGPDAEAFYIVFKDPVNRTARMFVQVNKTVSSDATR